MTDLFAALDRFAETPIAGFSADAVPPRRLKAALDYLARAGVRVQQFRLGDSPIPRYQVGGYTGSALACQVVGIARLKGMGL
ncbi:hypothetical protein SAMN02927924_01338 [Sphingobium faniae]|nr:hypothetical protein SAMN02927924_01338 [Sphingobium faniae]